MSPQVAVFDHLCISSFSHKTRNLPLNALLTLRNCLTSPLSHRKQRRTPDCAKMAHSPGFPDHLADHPDQLGSYPGPPTDYPSPPGDKPDDSGKPGRDPYEAQLGISEGDLGQTGSKPQRPGEPKSAQPDPAQPPRPCPQAPALQAKGRATRRPLK